MMRKCSARSLFLHQHIELEADFTDRYPAVATEIAELLERWPGLHAAVHQVSFFDADFVAANRVLPAQTDADASGGLLATCVIVNLSAPVGAPPATSSQPWSRGYMFEAVVAFPSNVDSDLEEDQRKRRTLLNNYFHVGDRADVIVGGHQYQVEAAYFCQSNGLTSVCAHSCLKMALWHTREESYQVSAGAINAIVEETRRAKGQVFDPCTITMTELAAVLRANGAQMLAIDCLKESSTPPYEYAYLLVESGIPTIIAFSPTPEPKNVGSQQTLHLMFVVGHTMNTDEWMPFAVSHYPELPQLGLHSAGHGYLSSCEWASHLIVHDDLLGPYMHIGPHTLARTAHTPSDMGGRIHHVIGVIPQDAALPTSPYAAQELGARLLGPLLRSTVGHVSDQAWRSRLARAWCAPSGDVNKFSRVLRTQIVMSSHYVEHLTHEASKCRATQKDLKRLKSLNRRLPERVWIVEFSLPRLFSSNRSKCGEIVLALDAPCAQGGFEGDELDAPLLFRVGDYIQFANGESEHVAISGYSDLYRRVTATKDY